jgi:hypothetical protein
METPTIDEMFRELSIRGYYLCYLDDEWCFGHEFLDCDDFPLAFIKNKDKDMLIKQGYDLL